MLLSIIIPVYNAEKFIERCVYSIINQTKDLLSIELVIINDGSTDNSFNILKKAEEEYSIIKLYNQENAGEGYTRNIGLKKAVGKYIWFIDADDYIDNGIIPNLYNTLLKKEPEIVLYPLRRIDLDGNIISEETYKDEVFTVEELIGKTIYNNSVCSKVFMADIMKSKKLSFNPEVKTATDFDFSFRLLFYCNEVMTLDHGFYNYIVNPNSVSNIRSKEHLERLAKDTIKVAKSINSFLSINESSYPERKKTFDPWVNNFLYGLMFSLFRFKYSSQFIGEIIEVLKQENNYPIKTDKMNTKKKLFMAIANHKPLFLLSCKVNRMLKK